MALNSSGNNTGRGGQGTGANTSSSNISKVKQPGKN